MNSAFEKLPEEKKESIIAICIEEFAKNGYDNTSTDVITSRAGISKGILFHYFKSKKNLYLYIIDYVIKFITNKTMEEFEKIETRDFFEKMKLLAVTKQRLSMVYANETKLILGLLTSTSPSISKEVEEIRMRSIKSSQEIQYNLMRDMIQPNFRKGVTMEKAIEITQGLFNQLTHKYLAVFRSIKGDMDINALMDRMILELDEYIEIIKYGIYDQERE